MNQRFSLSEETDALLKDLEERLAKLDTKWKLFFMGSREQRYPPEQETDKLAFDLRNLPTRCIMRARHQFMYSNLGYRFNILKERWNRFMRLLEEQGREAVLDAMGIHNPMIRQRASVAPGYHHRPRKEAPTDPYDRVYQEFVKAMQAKGSKVQLNRERFVEELKRQEQQIRKKVGDAPLEFNVVVENGKPKIKARVKRSR